VLSEQHTGVNLERKRGATRISACRPSRARWKWGPGVGSLRYKIFFLFFFLGPAQGMGGCPAGGGVASESLIAFMLPQLSASHKREQRG
jgi:hypothetical protein